MEAVSNKWREIADLFGEPNISVEDKIKRFVSSLDYENRNTSVYAKVLCYLSYRYFDGLSVNYEDINKRINEHLIVLYSMKDEVRTVWCQSLKITQCYHNILINNFEQAQLDAEESLRNYSKEHNPGGIVNAIRCLAILFALTKDNNYFIKAEQLFKDSVRDYPIIESRHYVVECITKASLALQVCSCIKYNTEEKTTLSIDKENPFNKCLSIISKVGEKWKYDEIYKNTNGSYGKTNHGKNAYSFLPKEPVSLVDVGCGHNNFIKDSPFDKEKNNLIGVDFSCKSADVIADASNLPFKDNSFVWITAFDVLEHIPENQIIKTLQEFKRVAQCFCFSISYRDSITRASDGSTLHPTVKPESWWIETISKFGIVTKQNEYLIGIFLNK